MSLLGGSHPPPEPQEQEKFYYEQIAAITGAGGWHVDFLEKKTYFDKQLRITLETPEDYRPSLKHALHFYDMEFHELVKENFNQLKKGVPYDHEVKMVTYTNKIFWARSIGKPVKDNKGNVLALRGVIINIDEEKKKEIALQQSLEIIEANNSRLFKFANYVSHNLKSHVNNLELTSQLVEEDNLQEEQKELFNNYREIAKSLSRTVAQLNEVVSIQNRGLEKRSTINLEDVLNKCTGELQSLISKEDAYIYSDFSEVPEVEYIQDFMDNIFLTLIKNGISNKQPDRKPEIKAYSIEEDGKYSIIIEDNGVGINMEKDGDRIFHMTKSSSYDSNNESVGLFIVKNQVEALGGKITVESRMGYGSKFIITL